MAISERIKNAYRALKSNDSDKVVTIGNAQFNLTDIKKDPGRVMMQIMKHTSSEYKKEIEHWTSSKQEARNTRRPRRLQLIELYTSILEDTFIYRQIEQRCLRITNKKFRIVDYKTREVNQDKTDIITKSWFKKLLRYAIESRFYGHSLVYVKELQGGQIKDIDLLYREHVVPEKHQFLKNPNDESGFDYTQPPYDKFTVAIGEPDDLGILNKLAPIYILKKHSWAAWDQFEEMFGLPIRWAQTDKSDSKTLGEIQNWLENMGTAAYGIFPTDMKFEIKESTRSDAFQVFDMKRKACNEESAICINGQTMTTMNGSSRSQGEVHERTQDEITVDDLDFIASWINDVGLYWINNHSQIQFDENDVFEWDLPEDLMAKLKIFQGVKQMGFELDQDQVEKTFGVKIAGRITSKTDKEEDPEPKK